MNPAVVCSEPGRSCCDFPDVSHGRVPNLEFEIIDPVQSPERWDNILVAHPDAHVFHSSAWARVLTQTYNHRPRYVAAFDTDQPAAAIPVMEVKSRLTGARGVSVPFSDFCPPLFFSNSISAAAASFVLKLGRSRDWRALHLHGARDPGQVDVSENDAAFYSHVIDLTRNEGELLGRCEPSVRRAIRKAQKEGIRVEQSVSRTALLQFCGLHCHTRRRHGLPPQPRKFFESIFREFIARGEGHIFLAHKNNRTIAAALFLTFSNRALYKFAASDLSYRRLRPNNLILWEAIRFYASRQSPTLHLGRTDLNDQGLRRFKLGWGSTEALLRYDRFDFAKGRWFAEKPRTSGIHRFAFRHMPLVVNRIAGAMIYPHLD